MTRCNICRRIKPCLLLDLHQPVTHLLSSHSPCDVMKSTTPGPVGDKKAHICPPSDATHPRDRWESLFVYSFMCRFMQLRSKVEGLESPMEYDGVLLLLLH